MKKHRMFTLLLALAMMASLAYGCAQPAPQVTPVTTPVAAPTAAPVTTPAAEPEQADQPRAALRVAMLKGPTGMGMVRLMQQNDAGEAAHDYTFTLAAAPDEISGKLITGEVDIAAAPINLASTLYAKTNGGVKLIALNTLGVLYMLENGESIQSFADLAGKTIYATGQGSTPEYILNYLLEKHGMADSVAIQYMNDHTELATLLAAGKVDIAMLPEPNVTAALINNAELRVALDLTKEWDAVAGGATLVQGAIVVRTEALEQNPDAIAAFLREYADSVAFVNTEVDAAAQLVAHYEVMAAAPAAKRAIPNSNMVCMTGEEMRTNAAAMLEVLFAANPQSIGGAMPGDEFYYMAE